MKRIAVAGGADGSLFSLPDELRAPRQSGLLFCLSLDACRARLCICYCGMRSLVNLLAVDFECFENPAKPPAPRQLVRMFRIVVHSRLIWSLAILSLICGFAATGRAGCSDRPGPGVNWSGCTKVNRLMSGYDFHGANLIRANLGESDLSGADLAGAMLSYAIMTRTRLAGAILRKADLTKATLDRADLSGADLSAALLVKAGLPRANLTDARLVGSNLEKAELGRALLVNADLTGAVLAGTNLTRADLRKSRLLNADLRNAQLNWADLRGADLSQASGLVQAQLLQTCGDDTTRLPSGVTPPSPWSCAGFAP
jgi:uncharacterized protein YjbI with pentapeptide repeats